MTAEILTFDGPTALDLPPERVLQAAIDGGVTNVVVLGYLPDGSEYLAASTGDCRDILWLLERAKIAVLSTPPDEGGE